MEALRREHERQVDSLHHAHAGALERVAAEARAAGVEAGTAAAKRQWEVEVERHVEQVRAQVEGEWQARLHAAAQEAATAQHRAVETALTDAKTGKHRTTQQPAAIIAHTSRVYSCPS